MQQAADQVHAQVLARRDEYGWPAAVEWTEEQTVSYEQARRHWHELATAVQAAVTTYATEQEQTRNVVEAKEKEKTPGSAPEQPSARRVRPGASLES